MRRGTKSECERVATSLRQELGLGELAPLNPRALAEHLAVPVEPLSRLTRRAPEAVKHFTADGIQAFSAMTIFPNWPCRRRVILYNQAHSPARQNSSLAHELAHGVLLHEPRQALALGCRQVKKDEEDEASWLGGALLVPRAAALVVARDSEPLSQAARRYGVSIELMRMRVFATGAARQVERASRRGRGRPQRKEV